MKDKNNLNCNPLIKKKTPTCLTKKLIMKMKNKWNKNSTRKITTNNTLHVLRQLKTLNSHCSNDLCLIKNIFSTSSSVYENAIKLFSPIAPKSWSSDSKTWLSNIDIRNVLNQYEKMYKEFKFIGPSPIDWYHKRNDYYFVCNNLKHLDLSREYNNGILKIGIVFNLDTHENAGTHWVALFIDIKDKTFFYFDSVGVKCPNRIKKLYLKHRKKNWKFISNNGMQHQKKKSECGMFCIFFIIYMLKNNDFTIFQKPNSTLTDENMEKLRGNYFNIIDT